MIRALLKNDLKYMKKDPMMIVTLLLPFILMGVYWGLVKGLPLVFGKTAEAYTALYMKPFQYVMITMGSSMPGVVMSLRILDDKDEHMLAFYAISPLKLSGYFMYRGMGSAILSLGAVIISCLGIRGNLPIVYTLYMTALGLLLTLAIGGLAKNKLQGMVCMKLTGIVVILPCIRLLGKNQMNWVLKCQPWDYAYELMMTENINIGVFMLYALLILALYLMLLYKVKRIH